jgi:hypothetical protein
MNLKTIAIGPILSWADMAGLNQAMTSKAEQSRAGTKPIKLFTAVIYGFK